MKISYHIMGRFGNNLFQYIATKILQNKLASIDRNYIYEFNTLSSDVFTVTDDNYLDILNDVNKIPIQSNIYLDGYFQFDKHIRENKEYIQSIINETNVDQINHKYTVSILAKKLYNYKMNKYTNKNNEAVIHLRLDDFLPERLCLNYMYYINIIKSFPEHINKIIIIVDKCKQQWELDYINLLFMVAICKNLIVQIESGDDILEDFCKMYYSINFISSNSTFSYLAGLLGNHTLTWCPNNKIRYPKQCVEKFDDNTYTFDGDYLHYDNNHQ
jgi:hypothetical protein